MKSDQQLAEILKSIWNKYCGIYPELKSFEMPVIRFDARIKKVWAYSYPSLNVIRISFHGFKDNAQEYISDIIPHEAAHQIDHNVNGEPKEDHNENWAGIMIAFGIQPKTIYYGNLK